MNSRIGDRGGESSEVGVRRGGGGVTAKLPEVGFAIDPGRCIRGGWPELAMCICPQTWACARDMPPHLEGTIFFPITRKLNCFT